MSLNPRGDLPVLPAGATAYQYQCVKIDVLEMLDQLSQNEAEKSDPAALNTLGLAGWLLTGIIPQENWAVLVFSRPAAPVLP